MIPPSHRAPLRARVSDSTTWRLVRSGTRVAVFARAIARGAGRNRVMTDERAERTTRICVAIIRHLRVNPRAADTAKGIADFWVPAELQRDQVAVVAAALRELERLGLVVAETLPDGEVIYRGTDHGRD